MEDPNRGFFETVYLQKIWTFSFSKKPNVSGKQQKQFSEMLETL
jgi:hypothetical protein